MREQLEDAVVVSGSRKASEFWLLPLNDAQSLVECEALPVDIDLAVFVMH